MATPKFKPGDIVKHVTTGERAFVDYYQYDFGTFTYVLSPVDGGASWRASEHALELDTVSLPTGLNKAISEMVKEHYRDIEPPKAIKCECGVDSIGGGLHSPWCPKANN